MHDESFVRAYAVCIAMFAAKLMSGG